MGRDTLLLLAVDAAILAYGVVGQMGLGTVVTWRKARAQDAVDALTLRVLDRLGVVEVEAQARNEQAVAESQAMRAQLTKIQEATAKAVDGVETLRNRLVRI